MRAAFPRVLVLGASLGFVSTVAHAQSFNRVGGATPAPTQATSAPPALPGASSATTVAPSNRPQLDMEPNEALFDAINRGDIAAARDAINRGAELNAHNLLGMTPMELSVDLGRNDISFMLLSMRGSDSSASRRGPGNTAVEALKPGKAAPAPRQTAKTATKVTPVAAPAAPQVPRLFANDGGSPNPGAGFLGFGGGAR